MNITKEQIKEWLLSRSTPENEILPLMVDVIHDCVKDLSPKWVSVDDELPPHKEWVLFKVKYKDWIPVIRSGYAKHYENGEVLIVIPEFGTTGDREVIGWMPAPK